MAKKPKTHEQLATEVHAAAKDLNLAMLAAAREGLMIECSVRRPDRMARRIFVDVRVSLELGGPPPEED